jgi:hypothetical protein
VVHCDLSVHIHPAPDVPLAQELLAVALFIAPVACNEEVLAVTSIVGHFVGRKNCVPLRH